MGFSLKGLFDTGTSYSAISAELARMLRLKPTADPVKYINMAGVRYPAHTFIVNLNIQGKVYYENVKVLGLPIDVGEMLVGLDVMSKCEIRMGRIDDSHYGIRIMLPYTL